MFIDADVPPDTILKRAPHHPYSDAILDSCEREHLRGATSALCVANIHFIIRKLAGTRKAAEAVTRVRAILEILPVTDRDIGEALASGFTDFEDGLQHAVAIHHRQSVILTRNTRDFRKAVMTVMTPRECLQL